VLLLLVHIMLPLLQKIDNKLLILFDKVISQALLLQVVAKGLSPLGIEGVEDGKLGGWQCFVSIDAAARESRVM
jgi:hypothetical protein